MRQTLTNRHYNLTKFLACHEKWDCNFTKYCAPCNGTIQHRSNFTKYCACHEKWRAKIWQKTPTALCSRFEHDSEHDPRMIRPWTRQSATRTFAKVVFHAWRSSFIPTFRTPGHSKFHQILRVQRKVTAQLHQIVRRLQKVTLRQEYCTLDRTIPWLNYSLNELFNPWLNFSLAGFYLDRALPWLNYSLTDFFLDWTIDLLQEWIISLVLKLRNSEFCSKLW